MLQTPHLPATLREQGRLGVPFLPAAEAQPGTLAEAGLLEVLLRTYGSYT